MRDTDKQAVLEQFDPLKRLELVDLLLQKKKSYCSLNGDVHQARQNRINQKPAGILPARTIESDSAGTGARSEL